MIGDEAFGQYPLEHPPKTSHRQEPDDPNDREDQAGGERLEGSCRQRVAEDHQHACSHHRSQHHEVQEPLGQDGAQCDREGDACFSLE
jgi:hypothetical protein